MRILLVEDDEDFALFAKKGFEAKGFAVDVATSGEAGLQKARLNPYAAVVLDMSLPGTLQGPEVLKDLRKFKPSIPVLMISGVFNDVATKVEMLDRCDDYMCKGEMTMEELIARLHAIMRRPPVQHKAVLKVADLFLDPRACTVKRAGKPVRLPRKQFALLEYLMRNKNRVLSQSELLEQVWNEHTEIFTNSVQVTLRELRKAIDTGHTRKLIKTVPGFGYKLSTSEA